MSYTALKREGLEADLELQKRGLVIYTFGNVSQIDRAKGVIAIKPSGVAYENMTADDMVIVDLDNQIVEGSMRPSSDTKTHTHLYRHFADIGGVTHTHSTYATASLGAGPTEVNMWGATLCSPFTIHTFISCKWHC